MRQQVTKLRSHILTKSSDATKAILEYISVLWEMQLRSLSIQYQASVRSVQIGSTRSKALVLCMEFCDRLTVEFNVL